MEYNLNEKEIIENFQILFDETKNEFIRFENFKKTPLFVNNPDFIKISFLDFLKKIIIENKPFENSQAETILNAIRYIFNDKSFGHELLVKYYTSRWNKYIDINGCGGYAIQLLNCQKEESLKKLMGDDEIWRRDLKNKKCIENKIYCE